MMQAGLIDSQVGRRLLDYPDLDAEENLANASQDYLHKILDEIADHGKYTAPQSDDNLAVAKKLVLEYIAQAKLNNLPEEKLDLLRLFNKQIDALMLPPQPMAPPGMAQDPSAGIPGSNVVPMANPQAAPVSQLLPNVNTQANLG
jgi:hypothetical protein